MRFLVALLLPLALAAQAPPAPEDLCSLSGQVINAATGEPVRRALVSLRRMDSSPAVTNVRVTNAVSTDAAGRFAVFGIAPGSYRLSAERSGFLLAQYGARGPNKAGTPLILEPGQKSGDIVIRLFPHGVISGRVLDEDGEPMTGVDVQVSRIQYMQGRKQLVSAGGVTTNDLGEYRAFALTPGRYYVKAAYRPNPTVSDAATAAGESEYVATFYPRAADATAATPLDVTAGSQLRNIDVTLVKLRTVTVKGRVTSEVAMPAAGADDTKTRPALNVILAPHNPFGTGGGNGRGMGLSPQGTFEFRNIVPGSYQLVALANLPGKAYAARMPLQVGAANIEDISITIPSPVTVTGDVKVDGETAEIFSKMSRMRVGLRPFEMGIAYYGPMSEQPLKPDGSFQLADVSADRYRVYLTSLPEGFYVKSIVSANVDVQAAGLDVSGGAPAPIQILLSHNAGQVTGTVLDPKTQKPVSAVTVVLVPQEKDRRDRDFLYRAVTTDQAGHFTFKNLVPGDYKVFAWEEVAYGAWMDPDFMAPHESRGEPVTVREGSPQSIQVNLIADQ